MSLNDALSYIKVHPDRDRIIGMYETGPPSDKGFTWCSRTDFPTHQRNAYDVMHAWVLNHGYDSSGYAMMQRLIQAHAKSMARALEPMKLGENA
jgi:hypothetical protein